MSKDWHLNKSFSVANVIAVAIITFSAIVGWANLKCDVKAQEIKAKQAEQRQDRQQDVIRQNEQAIQEIRTRTAVITNTQEQMQRVQQEIKKDIKDILNAVRK